MKPPIGFCPYVLSRTGSGSTNQWSNRRSQEGEIGPTNQKHWGTDEQIGRTNQTHRENIDYLLYIVFVLGVLRENGFWGIIYYETFNWLLSLCPLGRAAAQQTSGATGAAKKEK